MTSKERMMRALRREIPDRLPITIHQWQEVHLRRFMEGRSEIDAFRACGLDASVTPWVVRSLTSEGWQIEAVAAGEEAGQSWTRHEIRTPDGNLAFTTGANENTTFIVEHPVRNESDLALWMAHAPSFALDREALTAIYDETGDDGIVRGFVGFWGQPGPWQGFCELVGTQEAILWALDEPDVVHAYLEWDTRRKVDYVHREMRGARYDLIEHGGGAASSTVISPSMFREFCLPYDRRIIGALHEVGLPVVYHTCGGMMAILEDIPQNGCDASETLSPTGVGGDIRPEDRERVKAVLGSRVAMIGGIDQSWLSGPVTREAVFAEVRACFETFGAGGGYVCSASDHFFDTPALHLRWLAEAAQDCRY